jgi:putative DNA primase/helicase
MSDLDSTDGQLPVSVFNNTVDNNPVNKHVLWENFAEYLQKHKELSSKESGKLWSATRYKPHTKRAKDNVESLSCLVLDFDHGCNPDSVREALVDYEYVMHSTYNHTSENPRFRVIAPIYSEIPNENWGQFWTNVKDYLAEKGINVDTACSDPSRIYYEPSCPPGGEHFAYHNKERWLLEDNLKPERKPIPKSRLIRVASGNAQPKMLFDMAIRRATHGNRNETNFWLACQLRDNGVPYSEVDEWMIGYASVVSDLGPEPYTTQEALHCAQQAYGRPPREPMALATLMPTPSEEVEIAVDEIKIDDYPQTDSGNAELFAALFATKVRYLHLSERWLVWDGMHWKPDTGSEISQMCKEVARVRMKLSIEQIQNEPDKPGKKGVPYLDIAKKFARASESAFSRNRTEDLAMDEPPISVSTTKCMEWDSDKWLLGVRNGVVDLRTGICRPGQQSDRITQYIDIDFDPEATCPIWEASVAEWMQHDQELIDCASKAAGYSLCGDVSEQTWFGAIGKGSNGKSKFIGTLEAVDAPYSHELAFTSIALSRTPDRQSNDMRGLKGKRFVWSTEPPEGMKLDEARLKRIAGESTLTGRFLYHEDEQFPNTVKFWIGLNHPPNVNDDTDGFWRKLCLIPFNQKYEIDPDKPLVDGAIRADKELSEKLKQEYPGILTWQVKWCLIWQKEGLSFPAKVREEVNKYRADSDMLAEFISECVTEDPESKTKAGDTFSAYKAFCASRQIDGTDVLKLTSFGRKMGMKFKRSARSKSGFFYLGIRVKDQPDYRPEPKIPETDPIPDDSLDI